MSDSEQPQTPNARAETDLREFEVVEETRTPTGRLAAKHWELEAVSGHGDAEIARIAERQRGVVHRRQLLAAGISAAAIKHRLTSGRLHPLFRDVYLVGRPRMEPLAAATAAVMHFEGHGVLWRRTAGLLWDLVESPEIPVEVAVAGIDARSRRGLTVHRSRSLSSAEVRSRGGLPVTSPARTLVDLAGVLDQFELEAAVAGALRRRLATRAEIEEARRRVPGAKGRGGLQRLLEQDEAPTLTRSRRERTLLRLLRAAELPRPQVNAQVEGMEVDLYWPAQRLVVEFDGFAYHSDRKAFERDRLRDQRLTAAGNRVMRLTARQLDGTAEAVVARLAVAIAS